MTIRTATAGAAPALAHRSTRPRVVDWPPLAAIAVATICARAILLGNPMIHIDEQFYLLVGQRMLDGAVPYVDIWDRKPIGLFLIYALAAGLGDGIVAYQLIAGLFCAATAAIVWRTLAGLGLDRKSALAGALAYPFLLTCFEGGGGQSPVFYNAFMAAAGCLVLLAARAGRPLALGSAAMLLVGLALQVKYTVVFDGLFFGLALLWLQWRADRRPAILAATALGWVALALLPSLAAMLAYAAIGHFDAFWHANVTSSLARGGMVADSPPRLLLALSPLLALAAAEWRHPARPGSTLLLVWLAVALLAILPMRSFSLNYALPAMAPAALMLGMAHSRGGALRKLTAGLIGLVAIAAVVLGVSTNQRTGGRATAEGLAEALRQSPNCPYIFDGPTAAYVLSRTCLPSRYAFPSHLRMRRDSGLIGVGQVQELARVLRLRPGVVISRSRTTKEDDPAAWALFDRTMRADYRLAAAFPFKSHRLLVYRLKDDGVARPNCVSGCGRR